MQPAPTQHIYRADTYRASTEQTEPKKNGSKSLARSTTAIAMSTMIRRVVRGRRRRSKSCNGRMRRGRTGFLENKAAWWEGAGRDRKKRIEGEASQGRAARHLASLLQSSSCYAQKQR